MGSSNSKTVGTLLNFPKLQNDLQTIYAQLHPNRTSEELIQYRNQMNSTTAIRTAIEQDELAVFGKVGNGQNLPARVERLLRKLDL